jgi:hypothetical protein
MNVDDHFKLAREFDAVLSKLDPKEDGLAIIEMQMMAGTNYMNAVLHANGIIAEDADLTHSYKPLPEDWDILALPVPVQELMANMTYIEDMRKRYARGKSPDQKGMPKFEPLSPGIVDECCLRYAAMKEVAQCVFARAVD